MQFSAIVNRFIVKTQLNSAFTNDLKENIFFSKNVKSYRLCSFKHAFARLCPVALYKHTLRGKNSVRQPPKNLNSNIIDPTNQTSTVECSNAE